MACFCYSGAKSAERESRFGSGNGNFVLDDVECTGNEASIDHCLNDGWGSHNCGSGEVAGVVCVGWSNELFSTKYIAAISLQSLNNPFIHA